MRIDTSVADASVADYAALVIPGGVVNADLMRLSPEAVAFVPESVDSGKPPAVIRQGPWGLVEADRVHGRRLIGWPSLATDTRNAGGEWVDEPGVVDRNLITRRKPGDLEVFDAALTGAPERRAGGDGLGSDPVSRVIWQFISL